MALVRLFLDLLYKVYRNTSTAQTTIDIMVSEVSGANGVESISVNQLASVYKVVY